MQTIKGPGLHLAQLSGDEEPFNSLPAIARWAANLGFKAFQVPVWDRRMFDLDTAVTSQTYCDDVKGMLADKGLVISELSSHKIGQLVAVHPAYDILVEPFTPPELRADPGARTSWAVERMKKVARVAQRLGVTEVVTFSGSLAWPYVFPFPQRPAGLIDAAFDELARRWRPILDVWDDVGVNLCYEIHPSEDLFDGVTFEMFLERVGNHPRCNILFDPSHFMLKQLNYLDYIDAYHKRIRAFHVKDAEFNPTGRQGVYSGYQSWPERAGRFRSLGDGQGDFKTIFSKLTQYDYSGWATLEWSAC